ncbi:hypothetical protein GEMRC1_002795 [Eukaryota sp. GEM-RC1]
MSKGTVTRSQSKQSKDLLIDKSSLTSTILSVASTLFSDNNNDNTDSSHENKGVCRCTICKQPGHNKRRCVFQKKPLGQDLRDAVSEVEQLAESLNHDGVSSEDNGHEPLSDPHPRLDLLILSHRPCGIFFITTQR